MSGIGNIIRLDVSHVNDVERDITPTFQKAITLPIPGSDGLAVYVGQSACAATPVLDTVLRRIAKDVVRCLGDGAR